MSEQKVHLGPGAVARLPELFAGNGPRRIFAVIDPGAYAHSGAAGLLDQCFGKNATTRFTEFEPNPKIEDVRRGIESFRRSGAVLVVAFGGGTAIDVAKLIRTLAGATDAEAIVRGRSPIPVSTIPFIAIPTTAGTGSEATQFAVVYVGGQKFSLDHPSVRPEVAIIDPDLMATLPPRVTAATGLDALCQAIESIWAVGATDESVAWATEAVTLALEHLPAAVNRPTPAARAAMCRAAYLAGRSINVTRTTAPHALSYPVTSRYGIPHGVAVSLTLAPLLAFNAAVSESDCADPRGAAAVRRRIGLILDRLGATSVGKACERFTSLLGELNSPRTLAEVGIVAPEAIRGIIAEVNVQRLSNNPRRATAEALDELLAPGPRDAAASRRPPVLS